MKKIVSLAVCLLMIIAPLQIKASEQEYVAYSSFGFGPLEGEISSPCAIGTDESGLVYAIDKISRKGLVYLPDGKYFQTFAVPEVVDLNNLSSNISANMGMVAYPNGKYVHIASNTGEVSITCGVGTPLITSPVQVKLMGDMSCYVLDRISGLVKFDRGGNPTLLASPGKPQTLPNLLSFDVSPAGEIAILSIWFDEPKKEPGSDPNRKSNVQISLFDSTFKLENSFAVETTEKFSPGNGIIQWQGSEKIIFMSTDISGMTILDKRGKVLSESMKGGPAMFKTFVPGKDRYFFLTQNSLFTMTTADSKIEEIGTVAKDPMKFGKMEQMAVCGSGLAVYDSSRKDIQFFSKDGFEGLLSFAGDVGIILFTDSSKKICLYSIPQKQVSVYSCEGSKNGSFDFDPQIEGLSSISPGIGEEYLGASRDLGTIYRISKDGFFISKFGSVGSGEAQFNQLQQAIVGSDKNIYALDGNGTVKIFDANGKYQRSIAMPKDQKQLSKPESLAFLPNGDIIISDSGNDRLAIFGLDGTFKYSIGVTSPARIKTTKGDYFGDIGTFSHPGQIITNGDTIYVLDRGNLRVQLLHKEKVVPKISIDKTSVDFGSVSDGVKSEFVTIKNSGNGILEGSAVCDSNWVELPKKTISGNQIKFEIRLNADVVPYWNSKDAEIVINTNGGLAKITVKATKSGKLIKLQLNSTQAIIDGKESKMDVAPMLVSGNTMVPLRFIGEALNASVEWDATDKKVTYKLGKQEVVLWIGKKEAMVNGNPMTMAAAPVIVSGKTLVPLRFIGEALGASVEWVASTKSILIYYPPKL